MAIKSIKSIENFKFSKKNFDAISLGIKIPSPFKIKDFEVFGNVNQSKFSIRIISIIALVIIIII